MSLEQPVSPPLVAGLRARAHPLRLQMLSLLTGAAMSAAELARELHISQALASYHLRQLAAVGLVELVEERVHRGGRERRYRHPVASKTEHSSGPTAEGDHDGQAMFVESIVQELRRRSAQRIPDPRGLSVDAELWVAREDWERVRRAIEEASVELHNRARRPHSAGTVHVNTTVVMFGMKEEPAFGPNTP